MNATAFAAAVLEFPPANIRRTLYDTQWTSDGKTRFESYDFRLRKVSGALVGMPCQMQLYPNSWVRMTKGIQFWLFDVLCLSAYGKLPADMTSAEKALAKAEWSVYLDDGRCFTNRKGTDTRHDYVTNSNILAKDMEWEPLVLAGNYVQVVDEREQITTDILGVTGRYYFYKIRALDPENLPAPQEFLQDKCVCHTPTTITPSGSVGKFPQFGGKAVYPIWAVGGNAWVWERLID